jgi:ketosteroid isomerase-like protein
MIQTIQKTRIQLITAVLLLLFMACGDVDQSDSMEVWKQEILETEAAFAQMAGSEGIHKAFVAYAANDAVLMRSNKLIIGKSAIDSLYKGQDVTGLNWKPNFIEVAASGDLAYTYGPYTYTFEDTAGQEKVDTGVFHTVWKRQADGSWRFVWD